MESSPVPAPASTGSRTIADLLPRAAQRFADQVAIRHKRDGAWQDVSYAQLGDHASAIGRGLIELGIAPGERVCLLGGTRPEWTYADFAITMAGAVVVPIYPTSSPEECAWVLEDSGAVAVICEDAAQVAKVEAVCARLRSLRQVISIDEAEGALSMPQLVERGRRLPAQALRERTAAVTGEDLYTIIYTSGTTGPPKGCVHTHGSYRAGIDTVSARGVLHGAEDLIYLFLPLAHSFALLIQLAACDVGAAVAYYGGDARRVVAELAEVRPTFLPSVPRIFEKVHRLVCGELDPAALAEATALGVQVQDLHHARRAVPVDLLERYGALDETLFAKVRAVFGGRVREASSGGAPIAKEILEFFYACGIPVMEGYGMTETAVAVTASTPTRHRFGTVGRAVPGVQLRIADDGELLIKGSNIFAGYHNNADASFGAVVDGWLHTGDLGSIDEDGFLSITGRKKDIIITAGGKNLTPANIENDMKQCRWVSQAVMHGDRRPYPVMLVTLDEEEIVPWARERGLPAEIAALAEHPDVRALIGAELDRANGSYAQVEQVKRFDILPHDLSQEAGELTPTLKVKRAVVEARHAERLDALYAQE